MAAPGGEESGGGGRTDDREPGLPVVPVLRSGASVAPVGGDSVVGVDPGEEPAVRVLGDFAAVVPRRVLQRLLVDVEDAALDPAVLAGAERQRGQRDGEELVAEAEEAAERQDGVKDATLGQ